MMKITSGEHGCGNSALIVDQVFMSASVNSVPKLASSALSHPNRAQQGSKLGNCLGLRAGLGPPDTDWFRIEGSDKLCAPL